MNVKGLSIAHVKSHLQVLDRVPLTFSEIVSVFAALFLCFFSLLLLLFLLLATFSYSDNALSKYAQMYRSKRLDESGQGKVVVSFGSFQWCWKPEMCGIGVKLEKGKE